MNDPMAAQPEPSNSNPAPVIPISRAMSGDDARQPLARINTRQVATLLGFLPEAQARQVLLTQNFVDAPRSFEELHQVWDGANQMRKRLPRVSLPTGSIEADLPHGFGGYEEQLMRREVYQRWYEGFWPYRVRMVALKRLITPQYCLNRDYVDALLARAPEPGDVAGALAFAFDPLATIPDPVFDMIGGGAIVLNAPLAPLVPIQPVEWRRVGPHEIEVVQRIQLRPNLFQIVRFRHPGVDDLLIVVNGVHRAAALQLKGWEHIPALLRNASQPAELGFGADPGMFPFSDLVSARPPYVADLLNPAVTLQFHQRETEQVMKIIPLVEGFGLPA